MEISRNNKSNNSDDEYIEEEILVYVDIEPTSLSENQLRDASCLKIVGNEKNVVMQIDNKFFQGDFDYSIGTHVFFEKDEAIPIDPLYTRCEGYYKFDSKTNKTLKMSRVMLKDAAADDFAQKDVSLEDNELKITRTYEEALNLFLPPNRSAPREVSEEEKQISEELVNRFKNLSENVESNEDIETLEQAMETHKIDYEN